MKLILLIPSIMFAITWLLIYGGSKMKGHEEDHG
jgi:hypothetical protein